MLQNIRTVQKLLYPYNPGWSLAGSSYIGIIPAGPCFGRFGPWLGGIGGYYIGIIPDQGSQPTLAVAISVGPWLGGLGSYYIIVMARFGSEPRFEPEPMRTEPKFGSRFGLHPEPNLRSSSRFGQIVICLNLVRTGSNRTKSEQI